MSEFEKERKKKASSEIRKIMDEEILKFISEEENRKEILRRAELRIMKELINK